MPKKKKVNYEKLIAAVNAGKPSVEIQKEFGFKTSAQLKVAYADALVASGVITAISSSRGKNKADGAGNEILVNKRGSLVIPREMVESMGFNEGEAFSVRKTKSGVSLRKV